MNLIKHLDIQEGDRVKLRPGVTLEDLKDIGISISEAKRQELIEKPGIVVQTEKQDELCILITVHVDFGNILPCFAYSRDMLIPVKTQEKGQYESDS